MYNRLRDDTCSSPQQDKRNTDVSNYNMYSKNFMSPNHDVATYLAEGNSPDFFGPLSNSNNNLILKESFLQGRGHTISKCPTGNVVRLPSTLFSDLNKDKPSTLRVDLQSESTKLKKSCNGLAETVVTPYHFMPGRFEPGYQGLAPIEYTALHTRLPPVIPYNLPNPCATSYGNYQSTRSFARYSP